MGGRIEHPRRPAHDGVLLTTGLAAKTPIRAQLRVARGGSKFAHDKSPVTGQAPQLGNERAQTAGSKGRVLRHQPKVEVGPALPDAPPAAHSAVSRTGR